MTYYDTWNKYATFEGRATRSEYWTFILINLIITIILSYISIQANLYMGGSDRHTLLDSLFALFALMPTIAVSVRRIHDINLSGLWGWIFIPLSLPMFIVGLIGSKEKKQKKSSDNEKSLTKAVINHSKNIVCDIKPTINKYIEEHSDTQFDCDNNTNTINHDYQIPDFLTEEKIYEKVMTEIEEDKKIKGIWAKAFVEANGDENKTQVKYIKLRVNDILNKQKNEQKLLEEKEKLSKQKFEEEQFMKKLEKEKFLEGKNEVKLKSNPNLCISCGKQLSPMDIFFYRDKCKKCRNKSKTEIAFELSKEEWIESYKRERNIKDKSV